MIHAFPQLLQQRAASTSKVNHSTTGKILFHNPKEHPNSKLNSITEMEPAATVYWGCINLLI